MNVLGTLLKPDTASLWSCQHTQEWQGSALACVCQAVSCAPGQQLLCVCANELCPHPGQRLRDSEIW